jgi:hypothetical protein
VVVVQRHSKSCCLNKINTQRAKKVVVVAVVVVFLSFFVLLLLYIVVGVVVVIGFFFFLLQPRVDAPSGLYIRKMALAAEQGGQGWPKGELAIDNGGGGGMMATFGGFFFLPRAPTGDVKASVFTFCAKVLDASRIGNCRRR